MVVVHQVAALLPLLHDLVGQRLVANGTRLARFSVCELPPVKHPLDTNRIVVQRLVLPLDRRGIAFKFIVHSHVVFPPFEQLTGQVFVRWLRWT